MNSTDVLPTEEEMGFLRKIFFPSCTLLVVIGSIGMFGNMCIVVATIKSRHLHSPCNIMIAILALGDFVHQIAHFPYLFVIYTGITFVSQRTCFFTQLISAIFMQHSIFLIFIIGLDRLYCVLFPMRYKKDGNTVLYLILANVPPTLYSMAIIGDSYREMKMNEEKPVLCTIVGFFAGSSVDRWSQSTVAINFLTVILYTVVWILVWKKTNVSKSTKNSMKPLTVMLLLAFFGWFFGMSFVAGMAMLGVHGNLHSGLSTYAGLSINMAISSNYFVYKRFGTDYKKAFEELWGKRQVKTYSTRTGLTGGSSFGQTSTTEQR